MELKELIPAFAAKLGIEGLAAEDGACALEIDGIPLQISETDAGRALVATAVVGSPPPEKTEAFLELLLEANTETFGPQDRALGKIHDTGEVVLQWRIPTRDVERLCVANLSTFQPFNRRQQWHSTSTTASPRSRCSRTSRSSAWTRARESRSPARTTPRREDSPAAPSRPRRATGSATSAASFRDAIVGMFGGESRVPSGVWDAMRLEDYDKGRPLTARRIMAVKAAIESAPPAPPAPLTPETALEKARANAAAVYGKLDRDGIPATPEQIDEVVQAAIDRAGADPDALEVVVENIKRLLNGSGDNLRSAEDIRKRVDKIIGNLNEIREAAGGDDTIVRRGVDALKGLNGKSLDQGLFAAMIRLSRSAAVGSVAKITTRSSALDLHKAVAQFEKAVHAVSVESKADALDGADEKDVCRDFIAGLVLDKCGTAACRNIQAALSAPSASKLLAIYNDISMGEFDKSAAKGGLRYHVQGQGGTHAKVLSMMHMAINLKFGATRDELRRGISDYEGQIDMRNGAEEKAITRGIVPAAAAACERERRQYANNIVSGDGEAAGLVRDLYLKRMGPHPMDPRDAIRHPRNQTAFPLLNWTMASACKKFAAGRFEDTAFAKDRATGPKVKLPGGGELSRDPLEARDQIASLLTKGEKTTFGELDPAQQKKAWIVMSFLSGEMDRISHETESRNLDPQGAGKTYELGNEAMKQPGEITLELDKNGSVTVQFNGTRHPQSIIAADGKGKSRTMNLGEGSTIRTGLMIKIDAKDFDRFVQQDFTQFDDSNLTAIMDAPDGTKKLDGVANGIPDKFRFSWDTTIETTAHYDLR